MKKITFRDNQIAVVFNKSEVEALKKRLEPSHGFLAKKTKILIKAENKIIAASE
jgi:hypothetical protein